MKSAIWLGVLLCAAGVARHACAQTQSSPEKLLKDSLIGKPLVLQNMSAATQIYFTWNGHKPIANLPPWHAFAALNVTKVQLKGQKVRIEALRRQLTKDKSGRFVMGRYETPVVLNGTLDGDPAAIVPTLRDALFYPDLDTALTHVPKEFQRSLLEEKMPRKSAVPAGAKCDCKDKSDECVAVATEKPLTILGEKPPRVLSYVDPAFSKEAEVEKISGDVTVGIHLDETGAITNEWVLRDVGYGLDEQAAIAVRKYRFAPATCHDTPDETTLIVVVNFKIFAP